MTKDPFFVTEGFVSVLIFLKFTLGLIVLTIGVHDQNVDWMIFGAGHAFVLTPLWIYPLKN